MKTLYPWIIAIALVCSVYAQNPNQEYRWTNRFGRTVMAQFVDLEGNLVTLRTNGRLFSVGLNDLSPASAKLARDLDARQGAASINSKVLSFSRAQMGRRVGNGQCTSLATEALTRAGAQGIIRDFPGPGDYVWGTLAARVAATPAGVDGITNLSRTRGGDIIQMRNVFLQGRSPSGGTYWMRADHHTAVLESADPYQGTITVLHQNWNGSGVRRDVLILGDMKRGWMRIYRPVPRN